MSATGIALSIAKAIGALFYWPYRFLYYGWRFFRGVAITLLVILGVVFLFNVVVFKTYKDVPARALSPSSVHCKDAISPGWDVLSSADNDEWKAIDSNPDWQNKFACTIQRHVLPGYITPAGSTRTLEYDLAFLEFQEDGKPYALRIECLEKETCDKERGLAVRRQGVGQLEMLTNRLRENESNYVVVFVHGWRHDASIGDSDVARLRIYAAHAARFVADRAATDRRFEKTRVTAVYVGWRGARTDETWLRRNLGWTGEVIGTASAVLTLFDRKPVSEAVAPSALAALRTIENTLQIDAYRPLPVDVPHRMIVLATRSAATC